MIDPRWRTVQTVSRYLVLGILVVVTIVGQWGAWGHVVPTLILCAAAAVLMLVLGDLPVPWHDHPAFVPLVLTALIGVTLVLVLRDSWFGFLTIAVFPFAYTFVVWPWELLAVAATATVAGLAQSYGIGHGPAAVAWTAVVVAINVVAMCGLSWGLRLAEQQHERIATEAERSRLAREIHDTLAQGFAGIVTQLQAAEQAPDDATRQRHTDAALALARDGLGEARRSVQALRPGELNAVRLPEALTQVARNWSARTGIPVEITTSGSAAALAIDAEVALLRTAQEALANIERHADAHQVELVLRSGAAGVRLEVRDDGRGFDPAATTTRGLPGSGGFGLIAMRERIESVAGDLVVESRPGSGALVRAEVRL